MKMTFAAIVAVATIAAGSLATTPASAQRGLGAAVAGGHHRRRDCRRRDCFQPPGLWWPRVRGRRPLPALPFRSRALLGWL